MSPKSGEEPVNGAPIQSLTAPFGPLCSTLEGTHPEVWPCSPTLVHADLDVPIRSAQFAADRIAPIRRDFNYRRGIGVRVEGVTGRDAIVAQ